MFTHPFVVAFRSCHRRRGLVGEGKNLFSSVNWRREARKRSRAGQQSFLGFVPRSWRAKAGNWCFSAVLFALISLLLGCLYGWEVVIEAPLEFEGARMWCGKAGLGVLQLEPSPTGGGDVGLAEVQLPIFCKTIRFEKEGFEPMTISLDVSEGLGEAIHVRLSPRPKGEL